MSSEEVLRGACSCGRYNYVVRIPDSTTARHEAVVHFGTGDLDRRSQASLLSAWLKVPLTWYQSATVSYFPDERHDHIARTFAPLHQPGCQRKFCGFCGTHITYWTEEPASEQDYMNITLGSLRRRDIMALEDLDLLPQDTTPTPPETSREEQAHDIARPSDASSQSIVPNSADGTIQTSRSGTTGGISWFEDMIQGSQLGRHNKTRKGHGQSADGTTTVSWEVSEFYEGEAEPDQPVARSKRKADTIETDDTQMGD